MGGISRIKRFIEKIENSNIPIGYFILFFVFVINLRNFLELFFSGYNPTLFLEYFTIEVIHFNLFYITLAISLIILFTILLKEKVQKVTKIVLSFFFIVILPPILDLILSGGKGYQAAYITGPILSNFLTFFNNFDKMGITPGIKIEIILVLLGCFIYFISKKKSMIKSLFFTFLTYCVLFFYLAFISFLGIFSGKFNTIFEPATELIIKSYIFLLFFLVLGLFYLYNKRYLLSIIKDLRPPRLIFYELMFFLGIVIFLRHNQAQFSMLTFLNFFIMIFAIIFAWLFSVMTNNLEDCQTDKINNRKNSILCENIAISEYKQLSGIVLILALSFAMSVSFKSFFLIFIFIGNYFIYSLPPLRLKRLTFFSKIFIGLNALISILIGYTLFGDSFNYFPNSVTLFILIFLSAAANIIDIKDYKGDKEAGIKTLPVLLGLKKSKLLIGLFVLIAYIASYFMFFQKTLIAIPVLIFGLIQFYVINKEDYNEKPIFIILILILIGIIIQAIKL